MVPQVEALPHPVLQEFQLVQVQVVQTVPQVLLKLQVLQVFQDHLVQQVLKVLQVLLGQVALQA